MIRFLPHIIFILAIFIVIGAFKGDDSISKMHALKRNYQEQELKNKEISKKLDDLKYTVSALENDERAIEKAARNTRALAGENEVVFLFNEKK